MLSCSIWFSAPSFWIGGGLESRCVGHVRGADVAVQHPHHTHDLHSGCVCCISTSDAPDDGRMYPKHVELRIH